MIPLQNYHLTCLWLIFLGTNMVKCTLVMDLINHYASRGVKCLNIIREHNVGVELLIDTANVSSISVSLYDSNTHLPDLSLSGKDCLYNLLIFDSVDSSLQFLNRSVKHLEILEESKKLTWFEGVIPQEDSYYLRRDHSFYILVVDDDADQEQVKSLFSSDFFTKVLNAVALTGNRPITDSSVMWTKSPCQSVGPKLTNVWTQSSGFSYNTIFERDMLRDLSCRVIKGVTQNWPPFSYITKNTDGTRSFHGSEVTLFKAIAEHLNFEYVIQEPQVYSSFKGIRAEMLMGRSDVAWSQLYFTEWRWQNLDITTSYDEDQACLLHRKPGYLSPVTVLYLPFTPEVWMAVMGAIFASLCFSLIYALVYPSPEMSVYKLLTLTLASIYKKAYRLSSSLKSITIRLFFVLALIPFIILKCGYEGAMTSLLSISKPMAPLDTLEDFYNSPHPVGSFFQYEGRVIDIDILEALGSRYESYASDIEGAMEKLADGAYSIFDSRQYLRFLMRSQFTNEYGETDLHIAKECVRGFGITFMLAKDSIFTDKFGEVIQRLTEAGLARKWVNDEMDAVQLLSKISSRPDLEPFSMDQLQGGFYILAIGLMASLLSMAIECLKGSYKKKEDKRKANGGTDCIG